MVDFRGEVMSEVKPNYSAKSRTIFRISKNKENPYVMMDRRPIENAELSWGAKGVLAYLLSRPDNWTVRLQDLINRSSDGKHKIRGYIRELSRAGHIVRKAERDQKTKRFVQYTLEVYELPTITDPLTNLPQAEKPQAENQTLNDTDSVNDTDSTNGGKPPIDPSALPIDWQMLGDKPVVLPDEKLAKQKDAAALVGMGMGVLAEPAAALVLAFQVARGVVFTESQIKGQRKAAKALIEQKITPALVTAAVKKLQAAGMTVTDLYSITKTAIDLANAPAEEYTGQPKPHAL